MNENFIPSEEMDALKGVIVAAVTAGSALWGWFGWLILVWVFGMAVDYLSGTAAAIRNGTWDSRSARDGLWHKAGAIIAVTAAALCDVLIGVLLHSHIGGLSLPVEYSVLISPLVVAWYALSEIGSILENAVLLGANVPEWLRRRLKITSEKVGKVLDDRAGGEEDKPQ